MKIALITDTHAGARNDSLAFDRYFERFYSEVFFPYLLQHGIDTIVHGGDVFDRRKYINFNTLSNTQRYFFTPLKEYGMTMHTLVGNHDTFFKNTNAVNSVELLLAVFPNVLPYNDPSELVLGGLKFLLLPWICDDNRERSLEAIKNTDAQVVIGHLELSGFEVHRGHMADHGDDPKLFDKFDMVMSGHYHHKSHSGNITYLGAPYEMTWTDYADPKGFHIFDTETRELEFIENPFCMFEKIIYDDSTFTMETINEFDVEAFKDCYIKIVVKNKSNPYLLDVLVSRLEAVGVGDIQVVDDHLNVDSMSDDEIIDEAEDTLTILKKCVDQTPISSDKGALTKYLSALYSEALSVE